MISTELSKIRCKQFDISLNGIGTFPSKKAPRVLWTGVGKNESLFQLKNKVEFCLNKIGLKGDGRKYHPHVTLGRIKNNKMINLGEFLSQYALFKTESFTVTEFSLYSSILNPKGAIYRKEVTYQLN